MKIGKILGLVAGVAAVAGAAWYLTKKKKENTVLYSQEFDEALDDATGTPVEETEDIPVAADEAESE